MNRIQAVDLIKEVFKEEEIRFPVSLSLDGLSQVRLRLKITDKLDKHTLREVAATHGFFYVEKEDEVTIY